MSCCGECEEKPNTCCPNIVAGECIELDQTTPGQITINAKCPPKVESPLGTIDVNYNSITDTYEIEKECCDDRLVGITEADTCPGHLRDKLVTTSPLTRQIINQGACETMQLGLDASMLIDKDEKVSVDGICPAGYLKDQLCTEDCSGIKIRQKGCCMDFSLDEKHFRGAFVKVYLTADARVSYPASTPPDGANGLPNLGFWVDDIGKQDYYGGDETGVFSVEPIIAGQMGTYGVTTNCDGYYRVSHKGAVDVNYGINAFRKIVFVSDPVIGSTFCLDSKYGEPEQSPVNFLAEFDGADDPNSLKQFQIGQSEIFYLYAGSTLYAGGRMDNTVMGNAPAHLGGQPRPGEGKDGLIIVRHAGLSSGILDDNIVSRPESGYSRSVEYLGDDNMDRRSCNRCQ